MFLLWIIWVFPFIFNDKFILQLMQKLLYCQTIQIFDNLIKIINFNRLVRNYETINKVIWLISNMIRIFILSPLRIERCRSHSMMPISNVERLYFC